MRSGRPWHFKRKIPFYSVTGACHYIVEFRERFIIGKSLGFVGGAPLLACCVALLGIGVFVGCNDRREASTVSPQQEGAKVSVLEAEKPVRIVTDKVKVGGLNNQLQA